MVPFIGFIRMNLKYLAALSSLCVFTAGCVSSQHSDNSWFKFKAEDLQTTVKGKKTDLHVLKNTNGLEAAVTGCSHSPCFLNLWRTKTNMPKTIAPGRFHGHLASHGSAIWT